MRNSTISMMQLFKNKKSLTVLAIFSVLTITLAFYSPLASLALLSLGLSFFVIKRLTGHLSFSIVLVAVLSIPFFMFLLQFSTLGIWLISRSAPLDSALIFTFVILAITILFISLKKSPFLNARKLKFAHTHDVISLIAGFAFIAVIIMPVVLRFDGLPPISAIGFVDGNVDDAAHIGAVNDRVEHNRGVFLQSDHAADVRSMAVSGGSYPPGWHASNAAIARSFIPGIEVGEQTLWFYVFSKLFWFFILVVLFFRFGFFILSTLRRNLPPYLTLLYIAGMSLFTLYFLIDVFRLGSYAFIPQLISILFMGMLLLTYKNAQTPSERASLIALTIVVSMGGGLSWILTLPIVAVVILLVVYRQWRASNKRIKQLIVQSLRLLPLYLAVTGATLTQLVIMKGTQSGGGIIDHINEYGYIARYNEMFFIVVIVGVSIFILSNKIQTNVRKDNTYLIALISLLLALAAAVYMLQLVTNEQINYYFYKTLNVFYVVAIPTAIASLAYTWHKLQEKYNLNKIWTGVFALTSLLLIIGFPAGDSPTISYLTGKLGLDKNVSAYTYSYISNAKENRDTYAFYFNPKNTFNANISGWLMKTIPVDNYCFNQLRASFTDNTAIPAIIDITERVCNKEKLIIVTDSTSAKEFDNVLTVRPIKNISLQSIN